MTHLTSLCPKGQSIKWVDSNQPIEIQRDQLDGILSVIVSPSYYPVELARMTKSVKLVQTLSAGTDQIDKVTLGEMGIMVSNNGGGNAISVAELTVGLIISTYRKLQLQFNSVQSGNWAGDIRSKWGHQSLEIAGKTIGIIGLGRIGHRIAKRLNGWECNLVYSDIVDMDKQFERQLGVSRLPQNELLETADIVTLHVPLNKSTYHMISNPEFTIMKPTALLINASRGPVVDEKALARAISEQQIAGAALDVTEEEPTSPDNPLFQFENVLITPHLAANTVESGERSRGFAVANATRVASGEEPESVVIPD